VITLLAEAALRSLVLGALVWVSLLIFRPRNPHLQKTIWITVLVVSLVMPLALQWRITPQFDVPEYLLDITQINDGDRSGVAPNAASTLSPALAPITARTLTVVYFAGLLTLLARFTLGLVKIARIRASAVRLASDHREDIRISPEIPSPATFGSTILLPAIATTWTDGVCNVVLSHERAHVQNKDCYVQWLARLHTCFFWFSPQAWWLQRRLAELAELTSDDAVLEITADRTAYADLLLEIARHPPAGRVVMSAARPGISARIERILSNIPPALPPRRWVHAIVIAALIPPAVIAAATLRDSPTPKQEAAIATAAAAAPTPADDANAVDEFPEWKSNLPTPLKIVDWGEMGKLEAYYPSVAKAAGREGEAVVGLIVNPQGHVAEVRVLKVLPEDETWGFGAAADTVTRTIVFENTTGANVKMRIKVKFALDRAAPRADVKVPQPDASWTTTYTKN